MKAGTFQFWCFVSIWLKSVALLFIGVATCAYNRSTIILWKSNIDCPLIIILLIKKAGDYLTLSRLYFQIPISESLVRMVISLEMLFGMVFILLFFGYRGYSMYVNPARLKKMVKAHYQSKGTTLINMKKLTVSEKMRHTGNPFFFLQPYHALIQFSPSQMEYLRKVDVHDETKLESARFVALTIRNKKLVSLNEFDIYST